MANSTTVQELDRLIESGTTSDVKRYGIDDVLNERIREWFETPVGTLADLPSWGHNFIQFKHEPQGPNFEVGIEMALVEKLPADIEDLVFLGVAVEYLDIDIFKVTIQHQFGDTTEEVTL